MRNQILFLKKFPFKFNLLRQRRNSRSPSRFGQKFRNFQLANNFWQLLHTHMLYIFLFSSQTTNFCATFLTSVQKSVSIFQDICFHNREFILLRTLEENGLRLFHFSFLNFSLAGLNCFYFSFYTSCVIHFIYEPSFMSVLLRSNLNNSLHCIQY